MPLDPAADLFRWTVLVWLTVLGGCIGSFLNVAIYRLPRGQSLSHPGSHCPNCGHAIRWYHNIPVLSWLVLRGRCYDCRAPISVRYPMVEGIVAAVFFVLATTGPLSAAAISIDEAGAAAPSQPLWLAFAWESVLLSGLFALAVIDRDVAMDGEGKFPLPLVGELFLLAVLLPILMPGMLVHTVAGSGLQPTVRTALEHTGLGTLAGCGCGCLMFAASRGGVANLRQAALPALVGPYLGAWPTVALVAATLLVFAAPLLLRRGRTVSWWRWPPIWWAGTLGTIVVAHVRPAAFYRLVDSVLPTNAVIATALIGALLAHTVVSRIRADRIE